MQQTMKRTGRKKGSCFPRFLSSRISRSSRLHSPYFFSGSAKEGREGFRPCQKREHTSVVFFPGEPEKYSLRLPSVRPSVRPTQPSSFYFCSSKKDGRRMGGREEREREGGRPILASLCTSGGREEGDNFDGKSFKRGKNRTELSCAELCPAGPHTPSFSRGKPRSGENMRSGM